MSLDVATILDAVMSLDVVKDLLGLLGGAAMAVPFFKDFRRRLGRDQVRDLRPVFTPFSRALEKIELSQTKQMDRAGRSDLLWMLVGIALLIASFAVSLCISVTHKERAPPTPAHSQIFLSSRLT